MRTLSAIPAAATALALLAGCGSSSSGTATRTNASATTTPAASAATGSTQPAGASTMDVVVKQGKLGSIVAAGPKRMTVYLFEGDKTTGASACTGICATAWPPVTGTPSAGPGVQAALLGTITRSDGTRQVTYNGHPLYFFARDKDDGDAYGQGVTGFGASWYVLRPTGAKLDNS